MEHAADQQHPIGVYLKIWALLFVLSAASYAVDYFQCMRILYALHAHRVGPKPPLTSRRLVQLATLDGAIDLGVAAQTGSITPGKRADLILVRTSDINMALAEDPYEALVTFAQPQNIDSVIVDGRILRRGGVFAALDHGEVVRQAVASVAPPRAKQRRVTLGPRGRRRHD